MTVSYTHLDVYKRQVPLRSAQVRGSPNLLRRSRLTNLFLIHLPETKKIRALDAYQQKELHRNRTPICTESFAGKMVGARVKCSLSVPLDSSNSGEKLCDSWV